MDPPPPTPDEITQQVLRQLGELPDEMLLYVLQYVENLAGLSVHPAVAGIALEMNKNRIEDWTAFLDATEKSLNLSGVLPVDKDHNLIINDETPGLIFAWIVLADDFTTQLNIARRKVLPAGIREKAEGIRHLIAVYLNVLVGKLMEHFSDPGLHHEIPQKILDAYARICEEYID